MRTEFELEPILLFIYRYLEVLSDQFLKRECLSFDLGNLASRKVINDAEVSDTSITFEGILALPNLLQEDVDLVRRAKGSKFVLSSYFEYSAVLKVLVQEDLLDLFIIDILNYVIAQFQKLVLGNVALMSEYVLIGGYLV
jgi:hypothetical protein